MKGRWRLLVGWWGSVGLERVFVDFGVGFSFWIRRFLGGEAGVRRLVRKKRGGKREFRRQK